MVIGMTLSHQLIAADSEDSGIPSVEAREGGPPVADGVHGLLALKRQKMLSGPAKEEAAQRSAHVNDVDIL